MFLVNIAGKTALHWAAAVNNGEATLVLLQHGANRDAQDQKVRKNISRIYGSQFEKTCLWGLQTTIRCTQSDQCLCYLLIGKYI